MSVFVGSMEFEDLETATDFVRECGRATGDYTFTPTSRPEVWAYLEWYEVLNAGFAQVRWEFDSKMVTTRCLEDLPWDNGTAMLTCNGCVNSEA